MTMTDIYPRITAGPRVAARTTDDWTPLPYTRFTLQPMAPTIGAVVVGVSMADELDAETFAELNQALLEWKVLFFRAQDVTSAQHAAFAANWGALESHPFVRVRTNQPDEQEVLRLEKGPAQPGRENIWHSDVTWRESPSLGSVLRAIDLPQLGGDTLWSDMCAAYDCLPGDVKLRIDGMVAVHDWINAFGRGMDPATRDALRPDFPAVEHPVVRTHPETGRKMLYVNAAFTQHIVGLDKSDSDLLLAYLYSQAAYPEYQCRFRWEPGDVAFWDNRSTQHYASSDYHPQRRVMERITIVGDRPA
ncbi:MAG: TauD/TfdA family dioxygenase [Ilumatobacteraceae bacterium]